MFKTPFVTLEQLREIEKTYPTPYHIYDEKGIRENARRLYKAFSWNKGFKEYFAVKATPNPYIMKILAEEGCGSDCSSYTELLLAQSIGNTGREIMFSSNTTPAEDFALARKLGAIINLDDITHIDFLEKVAGIPDTICCRFNPGGYFELGTDIMDNPGEAKYGMTHEQIIRAYKILMEKGVRHFGIHSFLASNTVTNDYYPELARQLFELAVELKEKTGAPHRLVLAGNDGAYSEMTHQRAFNSKYASDIFLTGYFPPKNLLKNGPPNVSLTQLCPVRRLLGQIPANGLPPFVDVILPHFVHLHFVAAIIINFYLLIFITSKYAEFNAPAFFKSIPYTRIKASATA